MPTGRDRSVVRITWIIPSRHAGARIIPVRLLRRFGWVLLLAAPWLVPGTAADTVSPRPGRCACELSADDSSGQTILQVPAYALDRPELLLASLSTLDRRGVLWERLRASPDPHLDGGAPGSTPLRVTEIVEADPSRDRVVLRVPGLESCGNGTGAPDAAPGGGPAPSPGPGDPLIGLRARDGYRPRLFRATLDRSIDTGGGRRLMLIRIPDGGGTEAGILLDREDHLIGSILPPQAGSDTSLAIAVPVAREEIAEAAARPGLPLRRALGQGTASDFPRTAIGLFARAVLMTRPEQADEAIALMNRVAKMTGEFEGLLLERGFLHYRAGRNEAAIADFSSAARANPHLHLAYYNLGIALGTAGRYRDSSEAFARAAQIDPRHAKTRYQLILALHAANQIERAKREVDLLAEIDPGLASELRALLSF